MFAEGIKIQEKFNFTYTQTEIDYSYQTFETLFEEINLIKKIDTKNKEAIPTFIFREEASPLQAVVKFLKENRQLNFSQIGRILNRDPRTIWTEYNNLRKSIEFSNNQLESETIYIYSNIFKNRKLAPLEAISIELKTKGYSNKEISLILKKSQKTIWTVIDRAKKKIPSSQSLISSEVMFK